jgi:hypothetical protein
VTDAQVPGHDHFGSDRVRAESAAIKPVHKISRFEERAKIEQRLYYERLAKQEEEVTARNAADEIR